MNFINQQNIILIIISTLALVKIARDGLFYLWLWQIKEYRIDRMKAYLRDEKNIACKNVDYLVVLFLMLILYFKPVILIYLTLLSFIFAFYKILREIKNRTLKRPRFTFRILFTIFTIVVFYSITVFLWVGMIGGSVANMEMIGMKAVGIMLLLFFYLIAPVLITAIILFSNPFFNFQKKRIIKKATEKMRTLKKVKVIGITGSYGKTSAKEFLNAILSQKYKVIKTEGNNNTNIGVAKTVLNKVNDNYDYFICEMGAYKIGEIAEICGIVKPEIGILTGINEQHLDLFGSIGNTIKAKFELIEALPKKGIAILNGDNKHIESEIKSWENLPSLPLSKGGLLIFFYQKGDRGIFKIDTENIILYSLKNISNIKVHQDCVEFIYKNQKFKVSFFGRHYIENLLAAIITAEKSGMSLEEISEAVKKIKPSEFTIRRLNGLNNSVFIDDSYSANPDGVIAALNYLDEAYQDYKKIIVFPGIIELGKKSEETHRELFNKIGEVCDVAYILKSGILNLESGCEFIFEKDFSKVAKMLKNNLDKKTVVLFESRGAGAVMIKTQALHK